MKLLVKKPKPSGGRLKTFYLSVGLFSTISIIVIGFIVIGISLATFRFVYDKILAPTAVTDEDAKANEIRINSGLYNSVIENIDLHEKNLNNVNLNTRDPFY